MIYKINELLLKYKINKKKFCYKIIKIKNIFGISLFSTYKYIIVSEDTKKNAYIINKIRTINHKKKISIITIPLELDENKKIISTTNILKSKEKNIMD